MKLEVRVPISPRDYFFRRVKFLDRSLRSCGGYAAQARLVVSVGDDVEPFDLAASQPWSHDLVSWRWVDREAFRRLSYKATGHDYLKFETDADYVLLLDADTIMVSGIDDLLDCLAPIQAIAGVMGHVPPRIPTDWQTLFDLAGMTVPSDFHEYSGWGTLVTDPAHRFAPTYYNFGAVFLPARRLGELGRPYREFLEKLYLTEYSTFASQISLSLATYRLNIPHMALPLRYNFPNRPDYEAIYPDELKNIRILHFFETDVVHRDRDFASDEAITALARRTDLTGANEVLRRTVAKLLPAAPAGQAGIVQASSDDSGLSGSTAIIVLGMHRSGTSAVTGMLNLLGAESRGRMMPANEGNPRGYWENIDIVGVHDRLMAALQRPWSDTRPMPEGWWKSEAALAASRELRRILLRDFSGKKLWGIKDPRLCRLMPLWQPLLKELGIEPRYVLALRYPEEVAASLHVRDRLNPAQARLLWLRHVLEAEAATRGEKRAIIHYRDLIGTEDGWILCASEIARMLELDWPISLEKARPRIEEFLSPSLRHHREPARGTTLTGWIGEVAEAFAKGDGPNLGKICDHTAARLRWISPYLRPLERRQPRRNWFPRLRDKLRISIARRLVKPTGLLGNET